MNAVFLAVRAIGAEFARQLWVWCLTISLIVSALFIALLMWLTSLSVWWWLLALPIGVGISVVAALLTVFFLLIRYVRPPLNASQKKNIKAFVSQLQFVSEFTSTPKFLLLSRVVRSIAAPKSNRYLQDIFETKNLKKDFQAIVHSFRED